MVLPYLLAAASAAHAADFTKDVEPVLRRSCVGCHGAQQQMSGLRLDDRDAAMKGGYSGLVIRPGAAAESKLYQLVSGRNPRNLTMPPGKPLPAAEVAAIKEWIDGGAKWPANTAPVSAARKPAGWAFQPIRKPAPPPGGKSAIDAFIRARLDREKLAPSPEASRATLIRRLSLDLTGLPPDLAAVADFEADRRPDAYERLVDSLLDSPHYGEKWARHWLDLARYADSDGHENDRPRPHAWRYRDWVIDASNKDLPFDQFTIQQIAGDLLPGAGESKYVPTGFHRNTLVNREAGTNLEHVRFEQVIDRTNTVAVTWLGLALGCAQCHDHKYDPITQHDYYRLAAYFDTIEDIDVDAPLAGELGPYLKSLPEYQRKRDELLKEYRVPELQPEWERRLLEADANPGKWTDWDHHYSRVTLWVDNGAKILRTEPARRTRKEAGALTEFFVSQYGEVTTKKQYDDLKFKELAAKLEKLKAATPSLSQAQAIRQDRVVRRSYIRLRGDVDSKGLEVTPGVPAVFGERAAPTRLELAQWLVSRGNPLTARVAVNRIWQEMFGRGIVRTAEDLGAQGEKPTQPELLDWLAADLVDNGWSIKKLVRQIALSATYRQSSAVSEALRTRDPQNLLLARQRRLRLPAEAIRDSALAVSGLLDPTVGGRSVRPHQPAAATSLIYNTALVWKESEGSDRYRRGLYTHIQRTAPYPMMVNFDGPQFNVTTCRRERSNTPLQALNLLNDPVFFEAAQALAARVLAATPDATFDGRLKHAYQLALSRVPTAKESETMLETYLHQKNMFAADPVKARAAFPTPVERIDPVDAAAWTGISSIILNLDEFITRE